MRPYFGRIPENKKKEIHYPRKIERERERQEKEKRPIMDHCSIGARMRIE